MTLKTSSKTLFLWKTHLILQGELTKYVLKQKEISKIRTVDDHYLFDHQIEKQLQDGAKITTSALKKYILVAEKSIISLFEYVASISPIILVEDTPHIYNFYGLDIVQKLRAVGYSAWSVLNFEKPSSETHLQIAAPLLEKLTSAALLICSTTDLSQATSAKVRSKTEAHSKVSRYSYATPRGIILKENKNTKVLRIPLSANSHVGEQFIFDSDYIYVPNARSVAKIFSKCARAKPYPRELLFHRLRTTAIPLGNLKVHRARKRKRRTPPTEGKLILLFTGPYDTPASANEEEIYDLVSKVLAHFKAAKIFFRPHPAWVDHDRTLKICDLFKEEHRFVLDDEPLSENMIMKGSALITDNSNSGLSFSLITDQPAIYVKPTVPFFDEKALNLKFEDGPVFKFCRTTNEVINFLEKQFDYPETTLIDHEVLFKDTFSHLDDGEEYFFKALNAIITGRNLDDWNFLEISEDDISADVKISYDGLIEHDVLNFPAYPSHIQIDLDILSIRSQGKIFNKCATAVEQHSSYFINLLNWIIDNIVTFGFSKYKGLLLSGVLHSLVNMAAMYSEEDIRFILNKFSQSNDSDPEAKKWISELLRILNSRFLLKKTTANYISNGLDEMGVSCEIFWRSLVQDCRKTSSDKVALYGGGNYCKHLLKHVLTQKFQPDFVIETTPIKNQLIIENTKIKLDVIGVHALSEFRGSIIITSPVFHQEIEKFLDSKKFPQDKVKIINPFLQAETLFPLTLWH